MRKRSSYRPKGVNPTAHLMAMHGACMLSTTDALIRAEKVRTAVDEACKGSATVSDWRLIFDAVNMAEQLCKNHIAQGKEAIESVQTLIEQIHERQRNTGTRALHRPEMDALRDFAADYAVIVSGVTHSQYMQAQAGVEDRIRRILSTERIPASVRIVEAVE